MLTRRRAGSKARLSPRSGQGRASESGTAAATGRTATEPDKTATDGRQRRPGGRRQATARTAAAPLARRRGAGPNQGQAHPPAGGEPRPASRPGVGGGEHGVAAYSRAANRDRRRVSIKPVGRFSVGKLSLGLTEDALLHLQQCQRARSAVSSSAVQQPTQSQLASWQQKEQILHKIRAHKKAE